MAVTGLVSILRLSFVSAFWISLVVERFMQKDSRPAGDHGPKEEVIEAPLGAFGSQGTILSNALGSGHGQPNRAQPRQQFGVLGHVLTVGFEPAST
jgi:hypothetical protein